MSFKIGDKIRVKGIMADEFGWTSVYEVVEIDYPNNYKCIDTCDGSIYTWFAEYNMEHVVGMPSKKRRMIPLWYRMAKKKDKEVG